MPQFDLAQLPAPQHSIDTTGLLCPEPIMLLHRIIRQAKIQDLVHLVATDPSTLRDIPKFCTFLGHELVHQQSDGQVLHYWICKGS